MSYRAQRTNSGNDVQLASLSRVARLCEVRGRSGGGRKSLLYEPNRARTHLSLRAASVDALSLGFFACAAAFF